ncbi:hypothetical protein BH09BAC6_BH09BAC6_01410 [soil metagenome]|jgi:glycosyltransferase involved in cell wall biosynthesis
MDISVIIPTYNPDLRRLNQTLDGLKEQTLKTDRWELIIVDNNSSFNIADKISLNWHPNAKIVKEPKQGLTYARIRGFGEAKGDMIILVDDDNILEKNYLQNTLAIFNNEPAIGAIGGRSVPLFEGDEPAWLKEFYGNLALRDLGENIIISAWESAYPPSAPIGAGMALRKTALDSYISRAGTQNSIITDRQGTSLSSGGDNDMVLEILKGGWRVGYFPSLCLTHIIPRERMEAAYLARLVNNTNKSWIQLLEYHRINPWKKIAAWTVPLRKIKSWFTYKPWQNKGNYIKWHGACGTYDGLSRKNYANNN